MASLRNYTFKILPNEKREFGVTGSTVRVVSVSVAVPIYFETPDNNSSFYLAAGEQADFRDEAFSKIDIFHLHNAEVTVVIAVGKDAEIGSSQVSGAVTISNTPNVNIANLVGVSIAPIQFCESNSFNVTNVSQLMIFRSNLRRFLFFQNNHDFADVYLSINNGFAATVNNGIKIKSGESLMWNSSIPSTDIYVIGDIPSNNKFIYAQGLI